MVVLPKDDSLFVNLNAYYLDIHKLIEHLQGEIGSGGIFFKSYSAEGALFFDKDEIINGIFESRDEALVGLAAVERLAIPSKSNYNVSVYRIGAQDVYFWASLPGAEKIYKDLSNEFTDLEGLIKKMCSERLTGFIDVQFDAEADRAMIFLISGRLVGAASSWSDTHTGVSHEHRDDIVRKSKINTAFFNVCRIPMNSSEVEDKKEESNNGDPATAEIIVALEEFLTIFEKTVKSQKHIRIDFHKTLKHKFVKNAEKYAFLDPFAAEFEYRGQKITFSGRATGGELSRGVIFSVIELSEELGVRRQFSNQLSDWSERHGGRLIELDILV